jgi:hypothetical protein
MDERTGTPRKKKTMNNDTTTMKTATENPETKRLQTQGQAGTFYRVAWQAGQEQGVETNVYDSFLTAVQMAETYQTAANDRPVSIQFSVLRNDRETVYHCNQ